MKKKSIQLLALVVLLLAALAAFLLLRDGGDDIADETPEAQEAVYVLGGADQRFAKTIEVNNTQDTYTIQNGFVNVDAAAGQTESEHSIQGMDLSHLNQSTLRSAFSNAGSLQAKRVVAEDGADMALYGLGSPSATVKITYADGEATLLVGDDTPSGEGTYAAVDGTVFLVDTAKVDMFRDSRFSFVNRTITEGNSESTIPTKLVLTGGRLEEPVVIEKVADDEASSMTGFSSYRIVSPIEASANSQKGVTQLQVIFGLSATAVVADADGDGSALARYGLDAPYMTVEANAEEITPFTLAFSQPDSEDNVYVKSGSSPYIYQVSAAGLPFLELMLFDLQEKMIILPHIDSVSQVEVQADDMIYLFELAGEGDELTVKMGGKELTAANFRKFYQTLISASYDSEIGAAGEESEEASTDAATAEELKRQLELFVNPGDTAVASAAESESSDAIEPPESAEAADPDLTLPGEPAAGTDAGESETSGQEQPAANSDVLLKFTYRYRDGSPADVVTFEQGPARKAVVSLNGGKQYYARSVYVDRVLEDLPKMAADEEVKSYL